MGTGFPAGPTFMLSITKNEDQDLPPSTLRRISKLISAQSPDEPRRPSQNASRLPCFVETSAGIRMELYAPPGSYTTATCTGGETCFFVAAQEAKASVQAMINKMRIIIFSPQANGFAMGAVCCDEFCCWPPGLPFHHNCFPRYSDFCQNAGNCCC